MPGAVNQRWRSPSSGLRLLAALLSCLCLLFSGVASAQNPERAIALAEEGEAAFAAGDYQKAYVAFESANRMLSAPTVVVRMADCKKALGELVKARDLYRWAAAWQMPDPPPPPWAEATARASEELGAIEPRISSLRVVVRGSSSPPTVWLDGEKVDGSLDDMTVDPGEHDVMASADGRSANATINVGEGEFESVELDLAPDGPPHLNLPAVITMGTGGLMLIVAVATGGASLASVDDLKSRCQDDRCPAADQDQADSAQRLADASTASFIVAGAAIAAGIGLMWLPDDDEDVALHVAPTLGGLSATLSF